LCVHDHEYTYCMRWWRLERRFVSTEVKLAFSFLVLLISSSRGMSLEGLRGPRWAHMKPPFMHTYIYVANTCVHHVVIHLYFSTEDLWTQRRSHSLALSLRHTHMGYFPHACVYMQFCPSLVKVSLCKSNATSQSSRDLFHLSSESMDSNY
jgi:hypothetical protein